MQVKDELRVLVEAEVARAIENFKKLSGSVDETEGKTVSLGEALDSLSSKSLIVSGVLGGAGVAAIKFAGENEKLKLSLKNMLGSADEATAVFEEWRRLGSSPGLSSDEVFSLGKAMVNMGHDTEYATSTMQMLGNVAAGTGVSFGEISGSFERARAMGNLTTRDLVRLQQQGIPIVKQLAAQMGVSEESVRRLAAEGKIGFADLERAFKSMTDPGGQFAGMMNELSGTVLEKFSTATADAKQALAAFGEMLLPIATEMLDTASSVLHGITNMDEGAKRFVVGMGAVVAVAPPAITAIKGISAAMAFVAANPFMLAVGAGIAGAGIIAGLIYKQANAYEDLQNQINKTDRASRELLSAYAGGNKEKVLDEKTTRELIKLYPELTGVISANNTTVRAAEELQRKLNQQKVVDSQSGRIRRLKSEQEAFTVMLRDLESAQSMYNISVAEGRHRDIEDARRNLEHLTAIRDEQIIRIRAQQEEINEVLASVGKRQTLHGAIIDVPIRVTPDFDIKSLTAAARAAATSLTPDVAEVKKSWQEWFGEITQIDPSRFGGIGAKAAQLYVADFERGLAAHTGIADALGEKLDVSRILRSRQADVQSALVDLFSIDPDQINRPFTLMQPEIQKLIKSYEELGEKAKELENTAAVTNTLKDLWSEIGDLSGDKLKDAIKTLEDLGYETRSLTEDKYDLALASLTAANATDDEIRKAKELIEVLREANKETVALDFSFKEFSQNLALQFASINFSSLNNELFAIGEAFAKSEFAAENLTQAIANMSQQILNQLPNMFLQAGLQLIAQGQWALGLGFIAASGSAAAISGFVNGRTDATANAHGNVFDSGGIVPFAHGGAFTNQIVNHPTYFRYGGKFGVMGEAGPESIMPLKRMANGDLGVAASGGGAKVVVNIINNAGADVHKEERTDSEGNKQIDFFIGPLINNHITSGKADRAMARYGIHPTGV